MANATQQKTPRRLTSLELSAPARGALRRLKRAHGMSYTHTVERGISLVEKCLELGEPMPNAARQAVGLSPLPTNRRNGRKAGAK